MHEKMKLTSFENASLLRKITILYFIMSIVPVSVLYYIYLQVKDTGRLEINQQNFSLTLFLVVCGVGVGYIAMRSIIMKIADITRVNRQALEGLLGPNKIKSFSMGSANELAILTQSFNEITSRLEENVRNLELAKKTLHSVLSRVGEGISSMDNIDSFLNLILETMTDALQGQTGVLFLSDTKRGDLYAKAAYGHDAENKKAIRVSKESGIFTSAIVSKQPFLIDKLPRDMTILPTPILCAPLVLHDEVLGIITVCGRKMEDRFNDEEKNLLFNLALQTAVAIENSRLNEDAERTYFETISALAMAVEAKDPYSRGHLERVANYAVKIGEALNLSPADITTLRDAAKLHDLGKLGVNDKVLKKEGPLTGQEMDMMKKHCEIGEGIIKPIRSLRSLCDLVRHHHEKLDGSGYPDGLRGEEIHPLVRILAVSDIYDALSTDRPYRKAFTPEKSIEEMRAMRDKIDQKLVETLAKALFA